MNHQYRKRPVVIEAFQLTEETRRSNSDWPSWLDQAWNGIKGEIGTVSPFEPGASNGPLRIVTLEGDHRCDFGDWIIRGVADELYPCKPDIFDKTYEKVEPE